MRRLLCYCAYIGRQDEQFSDPRRLETLHRLPTYSELTTLMDTFEFPASLLEAASTITLKDLLDSPFSQPWAVSAIANAAHFAHQQKDVIEADVILAARLERIIRTIPQSEKLELYKGCAVMLQDRRNKQKQRATGASFVTEQN